MYTKFIYILTRQRDKDGKVVRENADYYAETFRGEWVSLGCLEWTTKVHDSGFRMRKATTEYPGGNYYEWEVYSEEWRR